MESESMDTVSSTIRRFILCTHLPGESPDTLSDDTPLQSSGILDSLATVGLIAFLEKEFQVELDVYDTAIERFDTVRDIASTVARKQSGACETSH
jgi:acyl carrier protein